MKKVEKNFLKNEKKHRELNFLLRTKEYNPLSFINTAPLLPN